jgi:hypothetical protein
VYEARRDSVPEDLPLGDFILRCAQYFSRSGCIVDQRFQPRANEGMVRCYLTQNEVVGFSTQSPRTERSPSGAAASFGMIPAKTMYEESAPHFQTLRAKMESEWLPAMQQISGIDTASLPAIWDADFLYGPKTAHGEDTYVLCEINVSAVYPFPERAAGKIANAAARILSARKPTPRN